jgi:hypothetical protein
VCVCVCVYVCVCVCVCQYVWSLWFSTSMSPCLFSVCLFVRFLFVLWLASLHSFNLDPIRSSGVCHDMWSVQFSTSTRTCLFAPCLFTLFLFSSILSDSPSAGVPPHVVTPRLGPTAAVARPAARVLPKVPFLLPGVHRGFSRRQRSSAGVGHCGRWRQRRVR